MKQILFFLISIIPVLSTSAQELSVKKVEALSMDTYASVHKRVDANDVPCALVRVSLTVNGVSFRGNIVGDVARDGSDYLVYMTDGSKNIRIIHPKYHELEINFRDYNIGQLYGLRTYRVLIDIPDKNDTKSPKTFTVNGVSFTMMPVEGGTFYMGGTKGQILKEDNLDEIRELIDNPHQVTLNSYLIGETEVTQGLWKAVMGTTEMDITKRNEWTLRNDGDDFPMTDTSYPDCINFINRLNQLTNESFRLPTEAEWEFAAKGGNKSKNYTYSGSNVLGEVVSSEFSKVKSKRPNELGIYDMSGSVWEWCSDWYDDKEHGANVHLQPRTNPIGPPTGKWKIIKGGMYGTSDYETDKRIAYCYSSSPLPSSYDGAGIGLRLVLNIRTP